jgi:hypothetical protein
MLSGLQYKEVRSVFVNHFAQESELFSRFVPADFQLIAGGNGVGLTRADLDRLLEFFGVGHLSEWIVSVEFDFGGHWVVRLPSGVILDPSPEDFSIASGIKRALNLDHAG